MTPTFIFLTVFLAQTTVIQGCLVVRGGKCECSSLALDSSNIQATVGSHKFYENITDYDIWAPKIEIDDCSVRMFCETEGQSLVVFDTVEAVTFGDFAAEGLCNAPTQTWLIDNGGAFKSYNRLFGVCVDFSTSKYNCSCPLIAVNPRRAMETLGPYSLWMETNSKYQTYMPEIGTNMCAPRFDCASGQTKVMYSEDYSMHLENPHFKCNPDTSRWTITYGANGQEVIESRYAFISCSDFNAPIEPPSVTCFCKHNLLQTQKETRKPWLLSFAQVVRNCFVAQGSCQEDSKTQLIVNGVETTVELFTGICDRVSNTWNYSVRTNAGWNMYTNQPTMEYNCID